MAPAQGWHAKSWSDSNFFCPTPHDMVDDISDLTSHGVNIHFEVASRQVGDFFIILIIFIAFIWALHRSKLWRCDAHWSQDQVGSAFLYFSANANQYCSDCASILLDAVIVNRLLSRLRWLYVSYKAVHDTNVDLVWMALFLLYL